MFDDVRSKAHEDHLIESLDFAVRMWMIRFYCEVFNTEKGVHLGKEFANKLSINISEYVPQNAVRDLPMIIEDIQNGRGCCFGS